MRARKTIPLKTSCGEIRPTDVRQDQQIEIQVKELATSITLFKSKDPKNRLASMKSNFHLNPNTGLYVSIGIAGVSSGGSNNVLYCEMMKTRFFLLREVMTACIYDACGVTSSVYLSQLTRSICRVMY